MFCAVFYKERVAQDIELQLWPEYRGRAWKLAQRFALIQAARSSGNREKHPDDPKYGE